MNKHKVRRVRALQSDPTRSRAARVKRKATKYLRLLKEQSRVHDEAE